MNVNYATKLKQLLGAEALVGQDVFHIIAANNGGADHPHNYLYALGSSFNRSIGDRYDDLNCFLAGKEKAKQAVEASMKFGTYNPIARGIPTTDPAEVAACLFGRGQALMSHVRYAKRTQGN